MNMIPDLQERLRAATDVGRNTLIIAGAGTGKTSLLAARLCYTLVDLTLRPRDPQDRDPAQTAVRSVAAITFTEKAATEMRERVRDYLHLWSSHSDARVRPDKDFVLRVRDHLLDRYPIGNVDVLHAVRTVVERLAELKVSTIHSFCAGLLRRYAFEAQIPPDFRIDDTGKRFEETFDEVWESYLQDLSHSKDEKRWASVRQSVRDLYQNMGVDEPRLREIARTLAKNTLLYGIEATRSEPERETELDQKYFQRLKSAGFFERLIEAGVESVARAKETAVKEQYKKILAIFSCHNDIVSLRQALHDAAASSLEFVNTFRNFLKTRAVQNAFQELMPLLPEVQYKGYGKFLVNWLLLISSGLLDTLLKAVRPCLEPTVNKYRAEGFMTYDDLLLRTVRMLKEHPRIRREIQNELHVLLVDEFQDTNRTQMEVVGLLARDVDNEKWLPGRIFIVGDPKQSIYGFLNADLAEFQRFYLDIAEAERRPPFVMVANFRSEPRILKAVNALSRPLFCDDGDEPALESEFNNTRYRLCHGKEVRWIVLPQHLLQPEYRPISPTRPPIHDSIPELVCFGISPKDDRKSRDEAMAEWIAGCVREWADLLGENAPAWGNTAVLFPRLKNNRFIEVLGRVFHRHGIPYVLEGDRRYFQKSEIIDLVNLVQVIYHPWDRSALYAVMRSPSFGFGDDFLFRVFYGDLKSFHPEGNLEEILGQSGNLNAWKRNRVGFLRENPEYASEYDRAVRFIEFLIHLRGLIQYLPPGRALWEIFRRTPILKTYAQGPEGTQRVLNLWKALTYAYPKEVELYQTGEGLAKFLLEQVLSVADAAESFLDAPGLNACQWMTIHKAKGLEFDLVILAGSSALTDSRKGTSGFDETVRLEIDRWGHPALRAYVGRTQSSVMNSYWAFREMLEEQIESAETKRLLYVAMTRARTHLVLVCDCHPDSKTSTCRTAQYLRVAEYSSLVRYLKNPEPKSIDYLGRDKSTETPIDNLPRSLSRDWHKVLDVETRWSSDSPWIIHPSDYDRMVQEALEPEPFTLTDESLVTLPSVMDVTKDSLRSKIVGSLVHEALARIPLKNLSPEDKDVWLLEVFHAMHPAPWVQTYLNRLNESGKRGEMTEEVIDEVRLILKRFLHSPLWESIRHRIVAREWPFLFKEKRNGSEQVWEGRIDVLFKDEDTGGLVVGDYKTDHEIDKDVLRKRYQGSMKIYTDAVCTAYPNIFIKGELILVRTLQRINIIPGLRGTSENKP